ncbi:MAG: VCBS repeat-containing protein [Myxococcota bacterium]|nr:VCBS repeat-containing protein [Myxococcota bacterium]
MQRKPRRFAIVLVVAAIVAVWIAMCSCGSDQAPAAPAAPTEPTPTPTPSEPPPAARTEAVARGLLVATSQFEVENGQVTARPGPARLEILTPRAAGEEGDWASEVIEDPGSNVFHKAMLWQPRTGEPGIVTLGGMAAAVKLWRRGDDGWQSETLWTEEFGGQFNRMRDAEIADVHGDGPAIVVATHDQGVVATVRPGESGWQVERIDREPNTFVHEIEIGDLNGDGQLEIYSTPSEPNDLGGGEQHGEVVRYVPRAQQGRTVVADLGNRHAKEIWVGDVDGDGRDELYVAVEALTRGTGAAMEIAEPVEIRRYDADTAPGAGVVIARIPGERLTRFLTVGDVDGDGRREMVIATFRSGLWLARPGRDPRGEWSLESVDRESSGFEHAALLTDLDGDGKDELYVGADEQGELRRYTWVNGRPRREVIARREHPRAIMTWNIMPVPLSVVAPR